MPNHIQSVDIKAVKLFVTFITALQDLMTHSPRQHFFLDKRNNASVWNYKKNCTSYDLAVSLGSASEKSS